MPLILDYITLIRLIQSIEIDTWDSVKYHDRPLDRSILEYNAYGMHENTLL